MSEQLTLFDVTKYSKGYVLCPSCKIAPLKVYIGLSKCTKCSWDSKNALFH